MNNQTPSTNASTPRTPPDFSPFSDSTALSEPTSDEQPDLGAFTTVLRAWNHFQPHPRIPTYHHSSSSSSRTYGRRSDAGTSHTGPRYSTASSGSTYIRLLPNDTNHLHPEPPHLGTPLSEQSPSNPNYMPPPSPSSPCRVSTSTSFNFDRSTLAPTRSSARELDVEELGSTVWNQPRIASYLESELDMGSRGMGAGSAGPFVEDEREIAESCSLPPSPDSEGSRTIEIASELDGGETRVDSVTLEADDSESVGQVQEVPFISASFNRAMNSVEYSSASQDDVDINLDIQDDQAVTPREISVMSKYSQRESTTSYAGDIIHPSSEVDFVSYANEFTSPSLSTGALNVHPISMSFSHSSSYSHAHSRLSNSFAGSSDSRYLNTASSLSIISYQLPNESDMSPPDIPRLQIEHSTLSPDSGMLTSFSEPDREAYVEHLNIPSPLSSFDVSPDPVVDIDPSPVPSNSPYHTHVLNAVLQEKPEESSVVVDAKRIQALFDRDDQLISSSLVLTTLSDPLDQLEIDPRESQLSSGVTDVIAEEPNLGDPTTVQLIHHGALFHQHQSQLDTPDFLHELSSTVPPDESQPSLGYLDEALSFIAAERAKWMVQRESGCNIASGDSKWRHVIEPRRKRRRKRPPKSAPSTLANTTPLGSMTPVVNTALQTTTTDGENDNDNDHTPRKRLEEGCSSPSGKSGSQIDLKTAPAPSFKFPSQEQSKKGNRLRKAKGNIKSEDIGLALEGWEEDIRRPKRERLQELARKLQDIFPEDRTKLELIINQLQNGANMAGSGRNRNGEVEDSSEADDGDLDPRGQPPTKDDTLIHVFIDHSNILIGLLSHLKRYPTSKIKETKSIAHSPTSGPERDMLVRKPASHNPSTSLDETTDDVFPFIPLPSFATASAKDTISRSLPTNSILTTYTVAIDAKERLRAKRITRRVKKSNSDGDEKIDKGKDTDLPHKSKRLVRHLWHAALALILERGRPISRRVLVTSSPLYQPMDSIERLGYEVRIYLRVPDLGNGMDRERGGSRHYKSNSASGNSCNSVPFISMDSNTDAPMGLNQKLSNDSTEKRKSSNTIITTNSDLHPFYTATHLNNNINANTSVVSRGTISGAKGTTRIKYREQGVDELLQLKLHQALAATDDVPDGSTIILATGDGNVGQFNEDGFLGPVRTALRRGWKVELYAWEDGLSRSWRREFGEESEWGRNGMFRIIGMEQFANRLVEAIA